MQFEYLNTTEGTLSASSIDIWEFSLAQQPLRASSLLNEAEHERANRYYFPQHQRRFTVARAMLRTILAHYLKLNPLKLRFSYLSRGKPQIDSPPYPLEFNLSHSQDLALLAIGQDPLGIDIEFFSARSYDGLAKHSFSSQENHEFIKLPSYLKPLAFFKVWAQKEAFIKASGLGLAYPLAAFDVPLFPAKESKIRDKLHNINWQLISFMPNLACAAALCCKEEIQTLRYIKANPLWLIS